MRLTAQRCAFALCSTLLAHRVAGFGAAGAPPPREAMARPCAAPLRLPGAAGLRCSAGDGEKVGDDFSRRAFLASTLAPLASVSLVYLAVPNLLSENVRKADWYKRFFADRMGGMDNYEANIKDMKSNLFSLIKADDTVVELGAGLGPNIKMFPASITYTAVEPNKYMHAAIQERAAEHLEFEQGQLILQDLRSVASGSADVVVSTLVLCSVADQNEILDDVLRVLKPGGMMIFLEHVIEPYDIYPTPGNVAKYQWGKAFYRAFQSAMSPLQAALADGCHADRQNSLTHSRTH